MVLHTSELLYPLYINTRCLDVTAPLDLYTVHYVNNHGPAPRAQVSRSHILQRPK
jgi:hypothetical protein